MSAANARVRRQRARATHGTELARVCKSGGQPVLTPIVLRRHQVIWRYPILDPLYHRCLYYPTWQVSWLGLAETIDSPSYGEELVKSDRWCSVRKTSSGLDESIRVL
jgi:hypothetical protein